MKEDIYTTIKDAKKEISKRWKDFKLAEEVNNYLKGDVPTFLNNYPKVALFRNIMTPNDESRCGGVIVIYPIENAARVKH
ncbi:MAG: hypothetical protein ABSE72_09050, partial [Bacteroidales bacterium]